MVTLQPERIFASESFIYLTETPKGLPTSPDLSSILNLEPNVLLAYTKAVS